MQYQDWLFSRPSVTELWGESTSDSSRVWSFVTQISLEHELNRLATETAKERGISRQRGAAASDTAARTYLFHKIPWEKVLHELPQVFPDDSVVEEGYFPVNEPQQGGSAVGTQVVGEAPLVPRVNNADSCSWKRRAPSSPLRSPATQMPSGK